MQLTAFLTCSFRLMFTCCVGSSLYYDEDGDLAHEFYEETVVTKNGRKKSKLKRIQKNLIPQVSRGHAGNADLVEGCFERSVNLNIVCFIFFREL